MDLFLQSNSNIDDYVMYIFSRLDDIIFSCIHW